jgi:hypothetical protein
MLRHFEIDTENNTNCKYCIGKRRTQNFSDLEYIHQQMMNDTIETDYDEKPIITLNYLLSYDDDLVSEARKQYKGIEDKSDEWIKENLGFIGLICSDANTNTFYILKKIEPKYFLPENLYVSGYEYDICILNTANGVENPVEDIQLFNIPEDTPDELIDDVKALAGKGKYYVVDVGFKNNSDPNCTDETEIFILKDYYNIVYTDTIEEFARVTPLNIILVENHYEHTKDGFMKSIYDTMEDLYASCDYKLNVGYKILNKDLSVEYEVTDKTNRTLGEKVYEGYRGNRLDVMLAKNYFLYIYAEGTDTKFPLYIGFDTWGELVDFCGGIKHYSDEHGDIELAAKDANIENLRDIIYSFYDEDRLTSDTDKYVLRSDVIRHYDDNESYGMYNGDSCDEYLYTLFRTFIPKGTRLLIEK